MNEKTRKNNTIPKTNKEKKGKKQKLKVSTKQQIKKKKQISEKGTTIKDYLAHQTRGALVKGIQAHPLTDGGLHSHHERLFPKLQVIKVSKKQQIKNKI